VAVAGAGYWALVVLPISQTAGCTLGYWIASGWRPGLPKRGSGVRQMLAFGGFLSLSRILTYAVRNLDNVLIGYYLGPGLLGIYSRAYDLLLLPMNQLSAPLINVGIPALSRCQNSPEEFRRYYIRGIELAGFLGIGIVAFTFAATEEIIAIFLGPQWMDAVPVFRALAPAAMFGSLNVTTGWLFIPLGRTGRQLVTVLFGAIIMIVGLFIGIHWGIMGVAISVSASMAVFRGPQVWLATQDTPIRAGDLFSALWCPTITAIAAGLIVLFAKTRYQSEPLLTLAISAVLFLCVYTALVAAVPRGRKFLKRTMHLTRELRVGRESCAANT
jgi:PST family polysaccharide transporter